MRTRAPIQTCSPRPFFRDASMKPGSPLVAAVLFTASMAAAAAEFSVLPLRVYLDRNAKSAEILVRNEDRSPLRMQLEAMGWQQDAEGADRYDAAEGLIYFPKVMEIGAG